MGYYSLKSMGLGPCVRKPGCCRGRGTPRRVSLLAMSVFALVLLSACDGGGGGGSGGTEATTFFLIAVTDGGEVIVLNQDDGSIVSSLTSGETGVSAMANATGSGTVYAGYQGGTFSGEVRTLDPFSGVSTGVAAGMNGVAGMSVRPSDDALFVTHSAECNRLTSIDPVLNTFTDIGSLNQNLCFGAGLGLTFDGSDLLYLAWDKDLYTVNIGTGAGTLLGAINFAGFISMTPTEISSMTVRHTDGRVFAIVADTVPATPTYALATLDMETVTATWLSNLPEPTDGLAFVGGLRPPLPPLYDFSVVGDTFDVAAIATAEITWREYPIADSFNIYWSIDQSGIDPSNPATYNGVTPDLSGTAHTFNVLGIGASTGATIYFKMTVVVGGVEVGDTAELSVDFIELPR